MIIRSTDLFRRKFPLISDKASNGRTSPDFLAVSSSMRMLPSMRERLSNGILPPSAMSQSVSPALSLSGPSLFLTPTLQSTSLRSLS